MGKIITTTIFLAGVWAAPAVADREFSFDKHESFDGGKITVVNIDIPGGEIELAKSTSNEIEVDFKNVIFAEDKDEAEDINNDCSYKTEIVGDKLTVTIDQPRRLRKKGVIDRLLSGDWEDKINSYLRIRIPDGKNVEVKSSSADLEASQLAVNLDVWSSSTDIRMRDTEGRLSFDLSSGDVDISHHKGEVKVKGNSSDLDFGAIEGNVDARTSSGDGSFNGVKGSISAYASSGDYKLFDIEGDLDVRTSSGDIYVSGVTGSIRAEASSGDITLKELSAGEGEFDVETSSGDVTLEIGEGFQGSVSLDSNSGSVYSRLSGEIESISESRVRENVGNGNGRLRVSTVSGDIRINRF
jgi:DUF4097 and DUF4098 domain-containing protein YvlB